MPSYEGAAIPTRSQRIDRALPIKSRGIWILTGAILVGGLILLFFIGGDERRRDDALSRVEIGHRAEDVSATLGMDPTVCDVGTLAHLRESFPEGWPTASVDVALEALAAQTVERWVYPVSGGATDCGGGAAQTELGVGQDGAIIWWVSIVGRSTIELPPSVTPAGVDSASA